MNANAIVGKRKPLQRLIRQKATAAIAATATLLCSCATTSPQQQQVGVNASHEQQAYAQQLASVPTVKTLKRKVAIGRFSNETRYGRTFQVDSSLDPLGKQASDMLATRLVQSQKFLVFERPDLDKVTSEQKITRDSNLIGVDALIIGSVTEFGRGTTGKSGFLSSTKIQTAHAKVEVRLVDARTGYVFFTATGAGQASTESGEIAGFGSKADYDGALNDKAIGAAISDLQSSLVSKLEERPWRTDILKVNGPQIYISGGARQGLRVGDRLAVLWEGESVKSAQTGFNITLPATMIGEVQVTGLFGDNETNEGAVAQVVGGSVPPDRLSAMYISQLRQ